MPATTAPIQHSTAQISAAFSKPDPSTAGCRYASPVIDETTGSTATASRPPIRATSLFTAEAMPTFSAGPNSSPSRSTAPP